MHTAIAISILLVTASLGGAQAVTSSDGDGVPDIWKTNGYFDVTLDGQTARIDLKKLGVRKGTKAVIVWVDWMAAPDHTHTPIRSSDKQSVPAGTVSAPHAIEDSPLQRVVRAFAGSGVDGGKGITLALIFADQVPWPNMPFTPIPEQQGLGATSIGSDEFLHYDWTAFDVIRASRFPSGLFGHGVHYAAFIHQMQGLTNTGLSKTVPGDEFLVSLGALANQVGDADDQCGTFMHELGHNLGLNHGGLDDMGYKPNYLSVMNYMFQRVGVANLSMYGHFDYSRFALPDVNENALSNTVGLSQDSSQVTYGTAHVCANGPPPPCGSQTYNTPAYNLVWQLSCPIDWKCTGTTDGTDLCPPPPGIQPETFALDVNGDGCLGVLRGFNDWSNLVYWTPPVPGGGETIRSELSPASELDALKPTLLTRFTVPRVQAVPVKGGVQVRWSRIPLQRVLGYEVLRLGPSGATSIVRRTKESEFVDRTAATGVKYLYSVRPVFAPDANEKAITLVGRLKDAVVTGAQLLERRAEKHNLLPPGTVLFHGRATPAAATVRLPEHQK
jgi:hypothetical protein